MSKKAGCIAVFALLIAIPTMYADDYEITLPEEVSFAIDRVVEMVIETIPYSVNEPYVVAVRSIELEDGIPPFGELFALTVSTRIALAGVPGLSVRSHLPVDSYLTEFSNLGTGSAPEENFSGRADYVLIGEAFETSGMLHLLFQVIEVESETIVNGLEEALLLDQWIFDLLDATEYDEGTVYVEPDRFEPDSPDDPMIIPAGEVVMERTIGPPGDEDWYVVETDMYEGKAILTLFTTGEIDTYMEVYGPDDPMVLLSENDDSFDSNAEVSVLAESGQRFWVLVRGYDETVGGSYSFHTESASFEGDPNEPDNTIEEANQLMVGYEPVGSYILPSEDEDWYFIDIVEVPTGNTILSVETIGMLDTFLDLYDADGMEMFSNDDGGEGDNARIDMFLESPGRFYVKVTHYDKSDQGEYQIYADFVNATPDQFEPDDSRGEAKTISFGESQVKNFTPSDDLDWVTFELFETRTVMITTSGDVDTFLKLFDRVGNMIAEDDDGGGDYNANIERMLQRGQYYVRVHQVEGDAVFGAEYQVEVETQ
jgi:hypothetical protein